MNTVVQYLGYHWKGIPLTPTTAGQCRVCGGDLVGEVSTYKEVFGGRDNWTEEGMVALPDGEYVCQACRDVALGTSVNGKTRSRNENYFLRSYGFWVTDVELVFMESPEDLLRIDPGGRPFGVFIKDGDLKRKHFLYYIPLNMSVEEAWVFRAALLRPVPVRLSLLRYTAHKTVSAAEKIFAEKGVVLSQSAVVKYESLSERRRGELEQSGFPGREVSAMTVSERELLASIVRGFFRYN
ncbi:hypothetical protein Desku_0759 [Desulfofundulus kuznetsovii DSM 6115]|uniref:HNH endonuclease 5 domain-containing protein n=1 Tax=Desulfofundulus kuznetsovii (strain DSM 6115 / VKM B-1805 / 17) TaxID=760568 RepID=A0AAU8PNT1_DESK7|nr:hypothetical protein Desku_0759 [Desulfofundulus kuznetsovii DSM 6115]